jgi:hypothetical protein
LLKDELESQGAEDERLAALAEEESQYSQQDGARASRESRTRMMDEHSAA